MAAIWARAALRRCEEVLRCDSMVLELTVSRAPARRSRIKFFAKATNCAARSARVATMMPQNSPPKKAQKLLGSSARAPPKAERLLGDDIPARSGTLNGNLERERRPSLSSKALALLGVTAEDVRIEKALLVMGEAPHRSASPEAPTRRGPTEEEWAEMMADSERVVVSMPTFRGPDGKAHDGCFIAEDRGLKVVGKHVDVFTGNPETTTSWNRAVPSNQGVKVVIGASRCAHLAPEPPPSSAGEDSKNRSEDGSTSG